MVNRRVTVETGELQGIIMEVKCGLHATHWHVVGDHLPENTMIWQDNNPFQHL